MDEVCPISTIESFDRDNKVITVPESVLKKRKLVEKLAAEKAAKVIEDKKVHSFVEEKQTVGGVFEARCGCGWCDKPIHVS